MAATTAAPLTPARRAELVKARATELGFDTVGVTDLSPVPHAAALDRWLQAGYAGTMTYMHRQAERRKHPETILPGATRAIVVSKNYYHPDPPGSTAPPAGRVAKYARGADYHTTLRRPLETLAAFLADLGDETTVTAAYVDAGPVPERELAQRAGLGWIGKNTMLIDPRRGSFLFLASVLTNLDLAVDPPFEADRCGSCTRCLDACPTNAFPAPRVLDATRCISYLTIEYRQEFSGDQARWVGDWLFGCDICQDVCPWNQKFAAPAGDLPALGLTPELAHLPLEELRAIEDDEFENRFGHTPLERAGASGLRRNATAVAGNIENREVPRIEEAEVLGVKRLIGEHCYCSVSPQGPETLTVTFVMPLGDD